MGSWKCNGRHVHGGNKHVRLIPTIPANMLGPPIPNVYIKPFPVHFPLTINISLSPMPPRRPAQCRRRPAIGTNIERGQGGRGSQRNMAVIVALSKGYFILGKHPVLNCPGSMNKNTGTSKRRCLSAQRNKRRNYAMIILKDTGHYW